MQVVVYVPRTMRRRCSKRCSMRVRAHWELRRMRVVGSGPRNVPAVAGRSTFAGQIGEREQADEVRLEVVVEPWKLSGVLHAMKAAHPYEEVAHSVWPSKTR